MDFHPRYDAVDRRYLYRVGTVARSASPFHRPWCWALGESLDPARLAEAAAALPGEHSFRRFSKAGQPERGERCTVLEAAWTPWDELGFAFSIRANRYLHHMVRYLVGTMVDVGRGRRDVAEMVALLEDPDGELRTSPPAPPEGLYLERVRYPVPPAPPHDTSLPPP
jgi:tRNA pseudouridine38-40 synthase